MKLSLFSWFSAHWTQQTKARLLWYKILAVSFVLLIVATGLWFSRPMYQRWKFRALVKQTDLFLQKKDYRSATLAAQQLMTLQPGKSDGFRIMADLERGRQSSLEIYWRRQVLARDVDSPIDTLALAEAYLRYSQPEMAANLLPDIKGPVTNTPAYAIAKADVATAKGDWKTAEEAFRAAKKEDPTNPELDLKLASLHLKMPDLFKKREGRREAEALISSPVGRDALVALITDALSQGENERAGRLVKQLAQRPDARFTDRLTLLDLLQRTDPVEAALQLKSILHDSETVPAQAHQVALWMVRNNQANPAAEWLKSLPPETKANPEVLMAVAECAIARQDWRDLPISLRTQDWGSFDFLRLAFTARAQRGLGQTTSSEASWGAAVSEATPSPNALSMLAGLAIEWKWVNETESLLWLSLTKYPWSADAAMRLFEICHKRGDSRSMRRLFELVLGGSPENRVAKNNFTFLSLLLGEGLNTAHETAAQLYREDPSNASYGSTYAFSLYLQGKAEQAKKVMDALPKQELETPAKAGYYALILKASGHAADAQYYAALAEGSARSLLPEERALFRTVLEPVAAPVPASSSPGN